MDYLRVLLVVWICLSKEMGWQRIQWGDRLWYMYSGVLGDLQALWRVGFQKGRGTEMQMQWIVEYVMKCVWRCWVQGFDVPIWLEKWQGWDFQLQGMGSAKHWPAASSIMQNHATPAVEVISALNFFVIRDLTSMTLVHTSYPPSKDRFTFFALSSDCTWTLLLQKLSSHKKTIGL